MPVTAAAITAGASLLVALLAFLLNQYGQLRQERRQIRLTRINDQIRDLYGPLNMLVNVNEQIWESLRTSQLPSRTERRLGAGTEGWVLWRDNALMPANRGMRDLILQHADLLTEAEIPAPLLKFCAHVTTLEVVLAAELDGVHKRPLIDHPGAEFVDHVRTTFTRLRRDQHVLLEEITSFPQIGRRFRTARKQTG
ncbi:hypothetical protein ACIBCD_34025 [Nocardia brasiliensis]|uniref:hypothetical protein n=1 Tax=Nocardia brasiliensis TaxID=37326 RepID=UPI002455BB01|nr:hypothetical protein [Nocardia brasiliensis]